MIFLKFDTRPFRFIWSRACATCVRRIQLIYIQLMTSYLWWMDGRWALPGICWYDFKEDIHWKCNSGVSSAFIEYIPSIKFKERVLNKWDTRKPSDCLLWKLCYFKSWHETVQYYWGLIICGLSRKSRGCAIVSLNDNISLEFDRHIGSAAAEMPVKFMMVGQI